MVTMNPIRRGATCLSYLIRCFNYTLASLGRISGLANNFLDEYGSTKGYKNSRYGDGCSRGVSIFNVKSQFRDICDFTQHRNES